MLTVLPLPREPWEGVLRRLEAALHERGATLVSLEAFGAPASTPLGGKNWPETLVSGPRPAGLSAWAVSGVEPEPVRVAGQVVGNTFDDGHVRYCRLGALHPPSPAESPRRQAEQTFDLLDEALGAAGLSWANVVRTWFYNDDILGWYDTFNEVRTAFYDQRHVFDGLLPASTGIGAANAAGTALVVGALAADTPLSVEAVTSPLQCSARTYGSSFSRAVEMKLPDLRRLYISGTASISGDGATLHTDCAAAQVERTLAVVGAILESRSMSWVDVTRAVVYVTSDEVRTAYEHHCASAGLPPLPAVVTEASICRGDLLFEVEVDALSGPITYSDRQTSPAGPA